MKIKLLLILSLISINSFAQVNEYMTNPDGTSNYIGNCALHMDYEGRGITIGKTVVKAFEFYSSDKEEVKNFYNSLPETAKTLVKVVSREEGSLGSKEEEYMAANYFDDFRAFEIKLDLWGAPKSKLTVVDYGVGGGNGGFMFFEENNGVYKVVAKSFDGDLLQCDDEYTFDNEF